MNRGLKKHICKVKIGFDVKFNRGFTAFYVKSSIFVLKNPPYTHFKTYLWEYNFVHAPIEFLDPENIGIDTKIMFLG